MRIATVNLLHGGGSRGPALADHIRESDIDVLVLTELRGTSSSQEVLSGLADQFPFVHTNQPPGPSANGVAVISRHDFRVEPATGVIAGEEHRWVEVVLTATGLRVVGLYVPGSGTTRQSRAFKADFWTAIIEAAPALADDTTVVIGDLNTGVHRVDEMGATFVCAEQFEKFSAILDDAWRQVHGDAAREFSWYSHAGNGFRIDHAFLSPSLAPVIRRCWYDHAPRTTGATDHSMLLLDIDVPERT